MTPITSPTPGSVQGLAQETGRCKHKSVLGLGREGGVELGLACAPQEILQCVNNSSETPLEHTAATRSLHRGAGIMHQKGCSRMDLRKVKPFRRTGCPAVAWAKGVLEHPPNTEQIQGKVCVNQVNVLRMSTELSVLSPGNFT